MRLGLSLCLELRRRRWDRWAGAMAITWLTWNPGGFCELRLWKSRSRRRWDWMWVWMARSIPLFQTGCLGIRTWQMGMQVNFGLWFLLQFMIFFFRQASDFLDLDINGNVLSTVGNSTNIKWHECSVEKLDRQKLLGQKGCVIWITGLSGSGSF